jgi:hypothetical protein
MPRAKPPPATPASPAAPPRPKAAPSSLRAETALWQFLGTRKDRPFTPFAYQAELFRAVRIPWPGLDPNGRPYPRIFTVRCGRRAGKTEIAEKFIWRGLLAPDDDFGPPTVRVTADTEEHAMKVWRRFIWHLENTPLAALLDRYEKEYMLVTLKTGATAQLISSNNPNAVAGDGVTTWIIDEAQYFTQAAWDNLYPSTSDRNGVILLFGVAENDGPFKVASYRGGADADAPRDPAYKDFCFPTAANPMISKYAIEEARRVLPPHKFRQLYLAQWVGELGKVFRNVQGCTHHDWPVHVDPTGYAFTEPPKPGHHYYGGLDLARLQDWTVFTIWDRHGKLVAWDRFNLVSWELQKARLNALSKRYFHPLTMVDATGVGDPVYDDLYRLGMNVEAYKISGNIAKRQLVDELAIRLGAGQLSFPYIGTLDAELERYEATRASENSQLIRYSAPSGMTDDFVMSCALAMQVVPPPLAPTAPSTYATDERQASAAEYI